MNLDKFRGGDVIHLNEEKLFFMKDIEKAVRIIVCLAGGTENGYDGFLKKKKEKKMKMKKNTDFANTDMTGFTDMDISKASENLQEKSMELCQVLIFLNLQNHILKQYI